MLSNCGRGLTCESFACSHRCIVLNASSSAIRLLEDLQGVREGPSEESPDTAMYDRLARHYADWVRLFQRSPFPEKSFVAWVTQLTAQGILKGEEISSFFYRVCVEASVTLYSELVVNGETTNAFQPVDALSRLIVLMIKYNGDAAATKVHYLTKILSIVVVVLAHFHEEAGTEFPQKPFFRLFSSLFNDLHTIEATLHGAYFQLLIALWSVQVESSSFSLVIHFEVLYSSAIPSTLSNRRISPDSHFRGSLSSHTVYSCQNCSFQRAEL